MEWFAEHNIDARSDADAIATLARLHTSRTDERAERAIDTEAENLANDLLIDLFDDEAITAFFADMRARYASADETAPILDRSIGTALPRDRVKILKRLLTFMDDSRPSNVQALAGVINRRAEEWDGTPGVREWFDESVKFVAEHHIKNLLVVEGENLDHWRTQLRFASTPAAIEAVCIAVADNLGDFTDLQLLAIAEYVANGLPEATRLELAQSILTDIGATNASKAPPTCSLGRTLVEFCWELPGARDRRPRWRAAHVARELLVHSRRDDFAAEWAAVIADPPPPRTDPPFLTMSASLWAWMVTARAVDENPEAFAHMRAQAAGVAGDRSFPHASIREFARRVALRLDIESESQGALAQELELANRPQLCAIDRQSIYNRDDAFEAARETVFDFDTMDTVRYWYQHLAELFALPTAEIVQRADRWITEVWGRTNEECTLDLGRLAARNSWQLMSNDHGSDPTVENLQTYLEYHAMLVVAGELLDEGTPVVCSPYDDAGDPWENWLQSRIDSSPAYWLADRRSAVPLDEATQGLRSASAVWDELVRAEDPVTALGLPDGWFWADGHADWSDSELRVSGWVSSAMVTPETGPALVRALLNSTPPSTSLPSVGSDEPWNAEIDAEGFVLRGWVSDRHDHLGGLDDDDPYWLRSAGQGSRPSTDFRIALGLTANKTETVFRNDAGEAVVTQQIWSNADGDEREISSGNRLLARLVDLKQYARRHDLDLIVGLMIDRYKRDRDYGGSDDDEEGNRVYRVWIIPSQE